MKLRVAYIPEHFSTPLFFAEQQKYFQDKGLEIEFVEVLEGTGRLIKLLNEKEVDVAIGLTEGFVADLGKGNETYKIVDTYVKSPLCWSISTGIDRADITNANDLQGKKISVSRIGSGSYIMSFVLGHQLNFPSPFFSGYPIRHNFKNLRDSVNLVGEDSSEHSEAFMWEHFTSKKYYDNKEIKKIGEIYTPWPSWVVTVRKEILDSHYDDVKNFVGSINKGIKYFQANNGEAVQHIATNLDYSEADATEWLKTVTFNDSIGEASLDWESVVKKTADILKIAGVLTDDEDVISQRLENGVIKKL
ncbi:hypothetical protein CLIB1423_09S03114 [[Candida] railenensis]|uniref:Ca3427-like PBP 2 domain-containing protein n=1 Tax=[Candida] railenensis TaxID=45579 RepID=A0A9P0QQM7_9ASCO|nr:hypothetical protein CLIB1423_09S03114 [[Candida] railenensis]